MSKKKYFYVLCGVLLVFAASFLSCGKSGGTSASTGSTQRQKLDVVLHIDNFDMSTVFADFARLHPEIDISYEFGQNVDTGVYSSYMADPDCAGIYLLGSGASRIMPLAEAGLLQDLTDIYTQRGWDKKVDPGTTAIIKRTSNGRLYEVANGKDVFVIKYWMDDFVKYGVEPPKTFDDFWAILGKIKAQGQIPVVVGVTGSGSPAGHWMSYFWQINGGKDFVEGLLYGDVPFTDPRSMQAARDYHRMISSGYFNTDALALGSAEQRTAFISRQNGYPMMMNQVTQLEMFADVADVDGIGTFIIPAKDPRNTMAVAGLAQTWTVAANSKQKDAAYVWLDYVLSPRYTEVLGGINGGWNNGMGASIIEDAFSLDIKKDYVKQALADLNKGTAFNCSVYLPGTIRTVYIESLQLMFGGNLGPEAVMQRYQQAKEEYLRSLR